MAIEIYKSNEKNSFPIGNIPWNKGLKGKYHIWPNGRKFSEETGRKISESLKGKKHTDEWKRKVSLKMKGRKKTKEMIKKITGENNHKWKGEGVSYNPLHSWIRRKLDKATKCEFCGKEWSGIRSIHWASKDHRYQRNLNDYISLCASCHGEYDKIKGFRRSLIY